MIRNWLGGAICAAGLASGAAAADFHEIFEARCLSCHGHAGDFARNSLVEAEGDLRGIRSGRKVADFLQRHAGGLSADEIDLFVTVFTRQLRSGGFYRDRCDICHDRAYDLARLRLILKDGQLTGRYTGRTMSTFLPGHARMTADEADRMLEALTALLAGAR
jgi:hypothetical protein